MMHLLNIFLQDVTELPYLWHFGKMLSHVKYQTRASKYYPDLIPMNTLMKTRLAYANQHQSDTATCRS